MSDLLDRADEHMRKHPTHDLVAKLAERLRAAEAYIEASPCDPDITTEQEVAYHFWRNLVEGPV